MATIYSHNQIKIMRTKRIKFSCLKLNTWWGQNEESIIVECERGLVDVIEDKRAEETRQNKLGGGEGRGKGESEE